jgi:hypothetical protein
MSTVHQSCGTDEPKRGALTAPIQYKIKGASMMYKAYCIHPEVGQMPPVNLKDPQEIFRYTQLQRNFFPEIIVVDELDLTVVHVQDHKYVFPEEWKALNGA